MFRVEAWTFMWWLNGLLGILIIFFGRQRTSRSTMMWLMVLGLVPILGFFFYMMFGADTRRANMFRLKRGQDAYIRQLTSTQRKRLREGALFEKESGLDAYNALVEMNLNLDNSILTVKNDCSLFYHGAEVRQSMLQDIAAAKYSIDFLTYIIRSDQAGKQFVAALIAAAARGIRVRMLVDAVGSRGLRDREIRALRDAGAEVEIFFPSWFKHFNPRMNYRNHRKILVIDDHIGYIGGFNIGDEYVDGNPRIGRWRDTHLRIDGDGAAELKLRFVQDWLYASGENPEEERDVQFKPHPCKETALQLVTSGPDTQHRNIKYAMVKMVDMAERSIMIQTPYLIPDESFMDALMMAVLRGVRVRIMIPCKPDHPLVYWATTSYAGKLIEQGAEVYRYDGGFLHAKVFIIDEAVSMVGTANVDERSFSLNFEASAILYDAQINRDLRDQFEKDCEESTLITWDDYLRRPLLQRIKEPVARLFSPLL